jgi:hypothetical protein
MKTTTTTKNNDDKKDVNKPYVNRKALEVSKKSHSHKLDNSKIVYKNESKNR